MTPALSPINHGEGYAFLAHYPFDFAGGNALQNRILTPLIAHYVGIRTAFMFIMFLNAICAFFAATAYVACRDEELPPQIAALAAAIYGHNLVRPGIFGDAYRTRTLPLGTLPRVSDAESRKKPLCISLVSFLLLPTKR